jgi:flagellar protein FliS
MYGTAQFSSFGPQSSRAANVYAAVEVNTTVPQASPHKLILMLFDGALQAIGQAQAALRAGNIEQKNKAVANAVAIIGDGLRASLDKKAGDLAERLDALYDYINRRLLTASLKKDIDGFAEAARLLSEVRTGWVEIADDPRVTGARLS